MKKVSYEFVELAARAYCTDGFDSQEPDYVTISKSVEHTLVFLIMMGWLNEEIINGLPIVEIDHSKDLLVKK